MGPSGAQTSASTPSSQIRNTNPYVNPLTPAVPAQARITPPYTLQPSSTFTGLAKPQVTHASAQSMTPSQSVYPTPLCHARPVPSSLQQHSPQGWSYQTHFMPSSSSISRSHPSLMVYDQQTSSCRGAASRRCTDSYGFQTPSLQSSAGSSTNAFGRSSSVRSTGDEGGKQRWSARSRGPLMVVMVGRCSQLKHVGMHALVVEIEETSYKTGWMEGGTNPRYDQAFTFTKFEPTSYIRFSLMHKRSWRDDKCVAEAFFNVSNIRPSKRAQLSGDSLLSRKDISQVDEGGQGSMLRYGGWICLEHKDKYAGKVEVDLRISLQGCSFTEFHRWGLTTEHAVGSTPIDPQLTDTTALHSAALVNTRSIKHEEPHPRRNVYGEEIESGEQQLEIRLGRRQTFSGEHHRQDSSTGGRTRSLTTGTDPASDPLSFTQYVTYPSGGTSPSPFRRTLHHGLQRPPSVTSPLTRAMQQSTTVDKDGSVSQRAERLSMTHKLQESFRREGGSDKRGYGKHDRRKEKARHHVKSKHTRRSKTAETADQGTEQRNSRDYRHGTQGSSSDSFSSSESITNSSDNESVQVGPERPLPTNHKNRKHHSKSQVTADGSRRQTDDAADTWRKRSSNGSDTACRQHRPHRRQRQLLNTGEDVGEADEEADRSGDRETQEGFGYWRFGPGAEEQNECEVWRGIEECEERNVSIDTETHHIKHQHHSESGRRKGKDQREDILSITLKREDNDVTIEHNKLYDSHNHTRYPRSHSKSWPSSPAQTTDFPSPNASLFPKTLVDSPTDWTILQEAFASADFTSPQRAQNTQCPTDDVETRPNTLTPMAPSNSFFAQLRAPQSPVIPSSGRYLESSASSNRNCGAPPLLAYHSKEDRSAVSCHSTMFAKADTSASSQKQSPRADSALRAFSRRSREIPVISHCPLTPPADLFSDSPSPLAAATSQVSAPISAVNYSMSTPLAPPTHVSTTHLDSTGALPTSHPLTASLPAPAASSIAPPEPTASGGTGLDSASRVLQSRSRQYCSIDDLASVNPCWAPTATCGSQSGPGVTSSCV
eukprot:GHVQ01004981.1.p1 GENE.GHVQ01004981.1~~GHVQ01004981.1.p1  ORF type:complete len:1118 (-),score=155.67 GHVQ01004981.1:419-3571(-)